MKTLLFTLFVSTLSVVSYAQGIVLSDIISIGKGDALSMQSKMSQKGYLCGYAQNFGFEYSFEFCKNCEWDSDEYEYTSKRSGWGAFSITCYDDKKVAELMFSCGSSSFIDNLKQAVISAGFKYRSAQGLTEVRKCYCRGKEEIVFNSREGVYRLIYYPYGEAAIPYSP